jgi:pimeloyl-ACP methyl ester carboxylesterase
VPFHPNNIEQIVLLPGLDGTGHLFKDFSDAIPDAYHKTVVSYPVDPSLDYDALENLVIKQLPNDPFILVAESFSGPIALKIAAHPPPTLSAVILVSTFHRSPLGIFSSLAKLLAAIPFWFLPYPTGMLRYFLFAKNKSDSEIKEFFKIIRSLPCTLIQRRIQMVMDVDVSNDLKENHVPLLYLKGDHDPLISNSLMRELVKLQPRLSIEPISSGHFVLQANPREAWDKISKFLLAISSRTS